MPFFRNSESCRQTDSQISAVCLKKCCAEQLLEKVALNAQCIEGNLAVALRTELVRGKGSAEAGAYTAAEVWDAVDTATPVLEVLGSRQLANGLTNWERAADGGEQRAFCSFVVFTGHARLRSRTLLRSLNAALALSLSLTVHSQEASLCVSLSRSLSLSRLTHLKQAETLLFAVANACH